MSKYPFASGLSGFIILTAVHSFQGFEQAVLLGFAMVTIAVLLAGGHADE